jgi:hypothetical protein
MALQPERPLGSTGWKLNKELQQDARPSYMALGRRVGLPAPATAKRVRNQDEAGRDHGLGRMDRSNAPRLAAARAERVAQDYGELCALLVEVTYTYGHALASLTYPAYPSSHTRRCSRRVPATMCRAGVSLDCARLSA